MADDGTVQDGTAQDGTVQSFARGLAVIRAFGADRPRLTLSEAARASGLSRATTRRFLLTLESLGYVGSDGREFALTPRVLELGYPYLSALGLPEVAGPHLEALSREVGESSSVSVLDGDDIVYVARASTRRIMSVSITIGTRFPAWVTAMGRVLLAALPDDQRRAALDRAELVARTPRTRVDRAEVAAEVDRVAGQGWSLVDGELETGLRSLAVPLRRGGAVVAAINVSTTTDGGADAARARLLPPLRATAAAIGADLDLLPGG